MRDNYFGTTVLVEALRLKAHMHIHTHLHTQTETHTHICTQTHTYTHIHQLNSANEIMCIIINYIVLYEFNHIKLKFN